MSQTWYRWLSVADIIYRSTPFPVKNYRPMYETQPGEPPRGYAVQLDVGVSSTAKR